MGPATRSKEKELLRDAQLAANLRRYEASIAAGDARTIELRTLRLARDQALQPSARKARTRCRTIRLPRGLT